MNVLLKNFENKNHNNKIIIENNNKKIELKKAHNQIYSKDKEFEIKKIKRKKFSATNNNFNLNKNNNYIILRDNTFNKLKEKDIEKDKKREKIRKNQKTMILEQDMSKETNTLSFYYMNNINTNKNNNQKNILQLNRGNTSRKESKKISKNLSRENMRGGGNNFLVGGSQRKKISAANQINNNTNNKILGLYDFNNSNKKDYSILNDVNEIIFNTNNINKKIQEKKNSSNNVIINSGNKFNKDKKVSLIDKFTNNMDYHKNHNQIKIDINNINNINSNNIIPKNNIPHKTQSNDIIIKNCINLSSINSKENIVKNIKNIIIENNNKNSINPFKNEVNIYNTNNTNNNSKANKDTMTINQQIKKIKSNEFINNNKKFQNLTITSGQNKLDVKYNNNDNNIELYNLNNKKLFKNKNKDKILNNITKNVNNLINKNGKISNTTNNNNNIYITYINNTSTSNTDLPKIKNNFYYNSNINKSITNVTEKLKNSSKKSINSINNITKLNTLQNEDIRKQIKYNNYKSKINFSSPKMPSFYERHNDKPHLRRPLSNNQKNNHNDKTYSPKLHFIPKYIQTENNNSNNNIKYNNNIINRLEFLENYSISSRKENIFSKINNNFKNNNYLNILNKRKLSAKTKNERGNSLLKMLEKKDKIKEKESVNFTKRRPRKYENEVNNLFTEVSNINNKNRNSFYNFGSKKIINNNEIIPSKLLNNFKNNKEDKNKKYSFINILKPKAISQQKRYTKNKEKEIQDNSKTKVDVKSTTFLSKDNKNDIKKNISLLRKKKIIKLIHMMDELNNSKSRSKSKRKNKSYNNNINRGNSAFKERQNLDKFKFNYFLDEDKIIENVMRNDITTYTIYIISKYNDNYKKIGLSKIKLYDKNNNEIFIIDSKSNIKDNEEENINYLFNKKNYYYNNKSFITDFKDNLYIKFYINLKKSNIIKYIKIYNYENNEEKVSPVKEIKIFHEKKKLYQGNLNINYFNNIDISENKNNYDNKELSFIIRKRGNSANAKKNSNSIMNKYNDNYKRNNTRSYSTFRANSGQKFNKIPSKQLVKINSERNIYEDKNIDNNKLLNYNNTEIDDKNYNNNIGKNICKTITYNNDNNYKNNIFIRERFISDNNIREVNNLNIIRESIHKGINLNKFNLNNYKSNYNNDNDEEELNNNNSSYIKFKRIRLVLSSNYGHPNFIGLTGIEFYDIKNKLLDIETAETIGAMPKDLHTIYNNDNDNRIFENIFNGENNVDDSYNMWVTLLNNSNKEYPYIELSFNDYIYLSKIKFFNYNKKNELDICAKTIDIFIDNKYYNTIHLRQGIGEMINENIIQKENSNTNNNEQTNKESNKKDNKNFCEEIFFPISKEKKDYYEKIYNKDIIENKFEDKINFEFASNKYEQSYETPFIPNGQIIKFQLMSNFYRGKIENNFNNSNTNNANILIKNYNYIGIHVVNIFDENGNDLLSQTNIKYKIISNKEMIIIDKHKIILISSKNEDNNNVYFLFDYPINISYIEIKPFSFVQNDKQYLNSAKEIKIFCDSEIIFEGEIYNYQPTIILFTSNNKIVNNINEKYLTKRKENREIFENKNEDCYSLIFKI